MQWSVRLFHNGTPLRDLLRAKEGDKKHPHRLNRFKVGDVPGMVGLVRTVGVWTTYLTKAEHCSLKTL